MPGRSSSTTACRPTRPSRRSTPTASCSCRSQVRPTRSSIRPTHRATNSAATVAAIGNDLIVEAPRRANNGEGLVYVFDADPLSPTFGNLFATISDPNGVDPFTGQPTYGQFGTSLAADGTEIAVGAPFDNVGNFLEVTSQAGDVYVFSVPSTSSFSDGLSYTVGDPNNTAFDGFGESVAFGSSPSGPGSELIVGATGYTPPGSDVSSGVVYVVDDSSRTLLGTIANPDPSYAGFGSSLAASGSNVVVGSPDDGDDGRGAAFLFDASGGLLATFTDPVAGGVGFGTSVASNGNQVLIGSPGSSLGASYSGAAYLFNVGTPVDTTTPFTPLLISTVQEPTPVEGDAFGGAVGFLDIDDNLMVAGTGGAGGVADLYAPSVPLAVSSATTYVSEGTGGPAFSTVLSGTFQETDPDVPVTVTIDWGDGSAPDGRDPAGRLDRLRRPARLRHCEGLSDPCHARRRHRGELGGPGAGRGDGGIGRVRPGGPAAAHGWGAGDRAVIVRLRGRYDLDHRRADPRRRRGHQGRARLGRRLVGDDALRPGGRLGFYRLARFPLELRRGAIGSVRR